MEKENNREVNLRNLLYYYKTGLHCNEQEKIESMIKNVENIFIMMSLIQSNIFQVNKIV
ncbi:hypothetical protein F170042I7_19990 [Blautia caecimuris]